MEQYSEEMRIYINDLEFNTKNEERIIESMPLGTFFWRAPSHREDTKPTAQIVFVYKNEEGEISRDRVYFHSQTKLYSAFGAHVFEHPLWVISSKKKIPLGDLRFAFGPLLGFYKDIST